MSNTEKYTWVGVVIIVIILISLALIAFNKKPVETPSATFIIGEEPAPVVMEPDNRVFPTKGK